MKKIVLIVIGMFLIAGSFIVVNKLYYPPSPILHLSAKDILHTLNDSNEGVVMLTKEEDRTWYITRSNNNGIEKADEKIKEMVRSRGWSFKDKEGSGLIFEKNGERLIVTTEMWTSKYVLVKVPENYE